MAVNKKLTVGPQILDYFANYWSRLTWKRVDVGGKEYWEAWYNGVHRADFFEGKSGSWFGVLFGRFTMWRRDKVAVLNTLTACIVGPQH